MSPVGKLSPTLVRARCWAGVALSVLLLAPQSRHALAGGTAPVRPGEAARVSQVQLDVVVVRVQGSLAGHFASHFLKRSGQVRAGQPSQPQPVAGILDSTRVEDLLAVVHALEKEHLARVVASPRLVTLSGNQASFLSGGERAVPVPAGVGQVGVQFEEFGTRLNFLPTVLGNGQVHLEAEPEVSTLDGGSRKTQRIHTAMELKAGQTLLIGGLGQPAKPAKDGELVVLVTPSVIRPGIKQHRQPKGRSRKEASQRLRRLERRLKRLQGEVDELHHELHSLHRTDPVSAGPQ